MSGSAPSEWTKTIASTSLSLLPMILIAGVAWGINKQSVAAIQTDMGKIATEVHGIAEAQSGIDKRVVVLEEAKKVNAERLDKIDATLEKMQATMEVMHDNLLLLCERTGNGSRCKR